MANIQNPPVQKVNGTQHESAAKPCLEFNESLYGRETVASTILHLRTHGWARLPNVFVRDSVDAFLEDALSQVQKHPESGGYTLPKHLPHNHYAALAPRIRQILPHVFSDEISYPSVSIFETPWLISEGEQDQIQESYWHKDRARESQNIEHYTLPQDIHISIYYRDTWEEGSGATSIVPFSHRDPSRNPHDGKSEILTFQGNKEGVFIWDQRCYHTGTTRTLEGLRLNHIIGFHAVPAYGYLRDMPLSLRNQWLESESIDDQIYFGGKWSRKSMLLE